MHMKIKEVCKRTGLTERTIRFYAGQGLVTPETTEYNGRVYLAFEESHVKELETVAVLRKAGFSVSQIIVMKGDPSVIAPTVSALQAELTETLAQGRETAQALESLQHGAFGDVSQLAGELERCFAERELPLQDREPHFGRFDPETPREKQLAYVRAEVNRKRRSCRKLAVLYICCGLLLAAASVLGTLAATGQLRSEPMPKSTFADSLIRRYDMVEYQQQQEPPRAVFSRFCGTNEPSLNYLDGGIDGVTGDVVAQYEWDTEKAYGENGIFTVRTDLLVEMEAETVKALGLEPGVYRGDPETAENKVEGIFELEDGRWCAVYLVSETLEETVLLDIAQCFSPANAVG